MLDYGFNFMNTKIYIDNESTICIVKNPVFHSKTKHIEIRHHFIRDSYEKRLIQVIKIHTDYNVADLLTKAFDAKHIEYLVGDKAVHKELGDRMERAATTASSLEAKQDSGAKIPYWERGEDAQTSTSENEEMEITATIDGRVKTITQASIRRHLKLEDADGISSLSNTEFFEQLALMGYASNSDKLTFQKGHFSPQWRILIHTILHCLSPKKTDWEQFSSNIATAIIFLATNRTFNFSKMIFNEEPATMPHDLSQPRVQSLGSNEGSLTLNELTVLCTTLSKKVEDLQNDLKQTKLTYGAAYTKLIMRVKKLEHKVKASKSRRMARVIISDNEEDLEDSYKQGRIIAEIDQNPSISLVQDEGTSWIQEDAKTQGRTSNETKILLEQEESTELVEDPGSGEKGEKEISIVEKKTKKQLEQERLGCEEAIRLKEDVAKTTQAHDIDWSDPVVLRYHAQQNRSFFKAKVMKNMCVYLKNQGGYKQSHFRGMSYEDIRPIFKRVWDQNQAFVPKDSELKRNRKKTLAKKRASEKQSEEGVKRQKMEDDIENEELKAYLDIVPGEELAMDVESLST
ncbi:hypothetical protein Tco_1437204, partial [Tanacetum coccineum]